MLKKFLFSGLLIISLIILGGISARIFRTNIRQVSPLTEKIDITKEHSPTDWKKIAKKLHTWLYDPRTGAKAEAEKYKTWWKERKRESDIIWGCFDKKATEATIGCLEQMKQMVDENKVRLLENAVDTFEREERRINNWQSKKQREIDEKNEQVDDLETEKAELIKVKEELQRQQEQFRIQNEQLTRERDQLQTVQKKNKSQKHQLIKEKDWLLIENVDLRDKLKNKNSIKIQTNSKFDWMIGLSIGLGVPVLISIVFLIYRKFLKK